MEFRVIDTDWQHELKVAVASATQTIKLICPFVKKSVAEKLFKQQNGRKIQLITRFNLEDFNCGASDVGALRLLLQSGVSVRGVRHLHTKLYLFDHNRAIVTSANLTESALSRNLEFGLLVENPAILEQCHKYFEEIWIGGRPLSWRLLEAIEARLRLEGDRESPMPKRAKLPDEGIDIHRAPTGEQQIVREKGNTTNGRETQRNDISKEMLLDRFWEILLNVAESRKELGTGRLTEQKKYARIESGIPGLSYQFVARKRFISTIELTIRKGAVGGSAYQQLEKDKKRIEKEFGSTLNWRVTDIGRIEKEYDYCGYADSEEEIRLLSEKMVADMIRLKHIVSMRLAKPGFE